jgi:hypothetical protein
LLGAHAPHERDSLRQAHLRGRIRIVIERLDVPVQVRGAQQREVFGGRIFPALGGKQTTADHAAQGNGCQA